MGKSKAEVLKVLADEPPIFVNGMSLATALSEHGNSVVTIQFFTTYPDPRTEDPDAVVRRYLPAIMMHPSAAEALAGMLASTTEEQPEEGGEGGSA